MFNQTNHFKMLLPLGLLLLVSATGCIPESDMGSDSPNPSNPTDTTEVPSGEEGPEANLEAGTLTLSNQGVLAVAAQVGDTAEVSFDTDIEAATALVAGILGEPTETMTNDECGAGPMSFTAWPNGFTLNAIQDQFVGWTVSARESGSEQLTTADGIGVGKTLAELEAISPVEVTESTLGAEFNVDGLFGILSANAEEGVVEYLWAGTACNFR